MVFHVFHVTPPRLSVVRGALRAPLQRKQSISTQLLPCPAAMSHSDPVSSVEQRALGGREIRAGGAVWRAAAAEQGKTSAQASASPQRQDTALSKVLALLLAQPNTGMQRVKSFKGAYFCVVS